MNNKKGQPACKPGSVWPAFADATAIHLGRLLPGTSRNQPGQLAWKPAWPGIAPGAALSLFGLAPGGVYHAAAVTSRAVGSYPTLSPLPRHAGAVCFLWHFP